MSSESSPVAVDMSALQLMIATVLCLYLTVLTDAETKGVVWRQVGEDVTIQCRGSKSEDCLSVWRGLNKTDRLFFIDDSNKMNYGDGIKERSQTNGKFPNVDFLIKNLNLNDMGPYWCEYKKMVDNGNQEIINGQGSVLLVVTDPEKKQECEPSDQSLYLVSAGIAGAVLMVIIIMFIVWIMLKTKSSPTTRKQRGTVTNDVYEDMRGTLRR